ncbi:hypothetical protein JTF06_05395 [Desemzia sp. RIT804]|uniref:hypothetical protein n=1 Tax=Desemzia sp. RIT 804 TaxID=2810209 RepID=UPI00194E223B|nr:hypothetical protein [Desemzia sp. RIT 804]MBM6614321.1 hypothetical protein [Desemzia sp. RIT 804]
MGLFNRVDAENVPLVETLGYELVEVTNEESEAPLEVLIQKDSVSKKETMAIAKELKKEKGQEIVVFASTKPISQQAPAPVGYNEDVEYKVTITENRIETIEFDVYKDSHPDAIVHQNWDLSDNVLDLVTGKVTVKIEMDREWPKDMILSTAQSLSQQIIDSNQESGVSAVFFEIKVGKGLYLYDSEYFYTIGEYQVLEI